MNVPGWGARPVALAKATLAALLAVGVVGLPSSLQAQALPAGPGYAGVVATEADQGPLEGPFADALLLPVGLDTSRPGVPPRLVVLRSPAVDARGVARMVVLERGKVGWALASETALPTGLDGPLDGGWILPLAADRFAVATPDPEAGATVLHGVTIYRRQLSTWGRTRAAIGADSAGVADVDGDGLAEIALLDRPGGLCGGSSIAVLSGADLAAVRTIALDDVRVGAAALGRFDERPGADLVAEARPTCSTRAPAALDAGVVLVSLAAGEVVGRYETARSSDADEAHSPASLGGAHAPMVVDTEGDGRDEVLVRAAGGLALLDARDGWAGRLVDWPSLPLAAVGDGAGGALIAALDGGTGDRDPVRIRHLAAEADGTLSLDEGTVATVVRSAAVVTAEAVRRSTSLRRATGTWTGDLDLDGCPDLLVPRLTLLCTAASTIQPGPGWYATAPMAAYGETGARRLIVAGTAAWPSPTGVLAAPTPAGDLAGATNRWRTSTSVPFVLTDLRVPELLYYRTFPVPALSMDRTQDSADELSVAIGGRTGERLFIRSIALDSARDHGPLEPLPDFLLLGGAGADERRGTRSVQRIVIPTGADSGADEGFARVPLGRAAAGGHELSVVAINDWGEVSGLEHARIEADRVGPALAVEAPLTSLPWPLVSRIEGVAAPGAMVRIGSGEPVEATRDGRFSIRTTLAPWPQTLEIHAVDQAGNDTVRRLTVIGGVDYRRLPWETILVGLVLAAALGAALRSPGRLERLARRPPRRLAAAGPPIALAAGKVGHRAPARNLRRDDPPWLGRGDDGEPGAVIEDLP